MFLGAAPAMDNRDPEKAPIVTQITDDIGEVARSTAEINDIRDASKNTPTEQRATTNDAQDLKAAAADMKTAVASGQADVAAAVSALAERRKYRDQLRARLKAAGR